MLQSFSHDGAVQYDSHKPDLVIGNFKSSQCDGRNGIFILTTFNSCTQLVVIVLARLALEALQVIFVVL
jgi:hypothetical protein